MSRRYWLPSIALGLILAISAHAQTIRHDTGSHTAAAQGQQKPKPDAPPAIPIAVQNDIHGIAAELHTANQNSESAKEEDRAKRYLQSQLDMAKWAGRMFGVGLLEALITFAGVILVWRTLVASRDAAGHAKRAADAARDTVNSMEATAKRQLRAYLNILEGGAGGGRADITMKNFGQTPANKVSFWADAIFCDPDKIPPFKRPEGATMSQEISVAPAGTFKIMPSIRDKRTPASISVTGRRPVIITFGEVTYVDAFNSPQSIEFFLATPENGGACRHLGPHNKVT